MLGAKIDNLKKLQEKNINIPKFIVLTHEEIINNSFEEIINNLDFDLYSVRSSANLEDSEMSSFAGQFDTFLNVKKDDLKSKILLCMESLKKENICSLHIF